MRHGLGPRICWASDGAAGTVGKLVESENESVQEGRGRKTEVQACLCVSWSWFSSAKKARKQTSLGNILNKGPLS